MPDENSKQDLEQNVFCTVGISSEGFNPDFFDDIDLFNLSLVSRALHNVTSFELKQRKAKKLLSYVVFGNQTKAQAMIHIDPNLLTIRSKAVDYSGRTIIATAFQAAIGAGDKPMWEMMLPYFMDLDEEEALKQFAQQFPNGIKEDVTAKQLQDYYNSIALAIINDNDHGESAIIEFRTKITSRNIITQDKHFNLEHLIAAYYTYNNKFHDFDNWDNRTQFWRKVIGYVQRQMTTYDAQIHCWGLENVLNNEQFFARTLKLHENIRFFSLTDKAGLGFDFACYNFTGWVGRAWALPDLIAIGGEAAQLRVLKKFCETKSEALAELERLLKPEINYHYGL